MTVASHASAGNGGTPAGDPQDTAQGVDVDDVPLFLSGAAPPTGNTESRAACFMPQTDIILPQVTIP